MAAAIAIITSLCGFRKKSSSKSSPIIKVDQKSSSELTKDEAKNEVVNDAIDSSNQQMKELPLPPSMTQPRLSLSSKPNIKKSASERKLLSTLSMKAQRSLSMVKNNINQKDEQKKGKLKHEDSIWMKTIILGEKCKVPHEESGAIIYEAKGKRISAYHPRTTSSLSVSRQCSSIEQDSIPVEKGKEEEEDDDDKQHQQQIDDQVVNMSSL